MAIPQDKIERIAYEVICTLFSRFKNFPENADGNRNAPFHQAFLNAFIDKFEGKVRDIPFFISLSSWLHGLNTTLGQSFFESVAHILSDGQKMEFIPSRDTLLNVTQTQKGRIADIITDLKNSAQPPNMNRENGLILASDQSQVIDANSFTADVFIEDANKVIAIELKSVKPNAGEMRGEKQKILEAKAALFHKYPGLNVEYYIGFPFDPTSDSATNYDKTRFLKSIIDGEKYFDPSEVLLASELWDYLSSDKQTMEQIILIINDIATTAFLNIYAFLNDHANRQNKKEEYRTYCTNWHLNKELILLNSDEVILERINGNSGLIKTYNQPIFIKGEYNHVRSSTLSSLL